MSESYYFSGKRIYLRNVRIEDINPTYCSWLNNPEVNQYLETRFSYHTIKSTKKYLKTMNADKDSIFLAICLKKSDTHIGNIKLGAINRCHNFADISLFIGDQKCWGYGYALEAILLLCDFAFEQLHLNKLMAGCYGNNIGSKKAFEKAGFNQEGILKKFYLCNDTYVDGFIFCLLKEGWLKQKGCFDKCLIGKA